MENREDDEIDLIDLFIVLLKHRKLILGSILAALVILGAGYFIYPSYQFNKTLDSQPYEANVEIKINPISKIIITDYDPLKNFLNASIILSSLQKAGYKELGYRENEMVDISPDGDNQKALNIVRQYLVKNQTLFGNQLGEGSRILKVTESNITFVDKNSDMAIEFLIALVENVNKKILLDITPKLKMVVSSYNNLLTVEIPYEKIKEVLVRDYKEYQVSVKILQGEFNFFEIEDKPFIFQAKFTIEKFKSSYKKTAVIVLFAVFFLSIFLAFILKFLEQIKSNDKSMAKIREAMKKK